MKKFFEALLEQVNHFLGTSVPKTIETETRPVSQHLDTIQKALYKKAAVHVIYSDRSFTGDIVKLDQDRQQLVVKNFDKRVTTIIRLADIKRISLVPDSVRKSQFLK